MSGEGSPGLDVLEAVRGLERHRAVVDERAAGLVVRRQGRMREKHRRVGEDHKHFRGRTIAAGPWIPEEEAAVQLRDFS
jgi:hypothetical protein